MDQVLISTITVSVRGLVEFLLRHGDIDDRRKAASGPEVMLEGANIHRMIQKRMGRGYYPEVYLSARIRRRDYEIVVDGRADGIMVPTKDNEKEPAFLGDASDRVARLEIEDVEEGAVTYPDKAALLTGREDLSGGISQVITIDEIKTTHRDLERIKEPEREHQAQAMCYAYMVACAGGLEKVGVRITYCNTETKEIRYFDSLYTSEEITAWFSGLMKSYIRWTDHETGWKKIRDMSIEAMKFPYAYRPGQKELMAQVYASAGKGERLFVMAPTGVGKTLASVYPSLKALAKDKADRIFYLTAKTVTRAVAGDCLNILRHPPGRECDISLRLKSVTITAKEKICPQDQCRCNPDACPYAKGHFDRINDAMYDLLVNEDEFSREKVTEYAKKHMVCPFEFSLDMSLFSDMIICDYNYAFDPNVYLRRFFSETASGRYMFLVDEAHNLVERAMKMYSARLVKEDFLDIKRLVKDVDHRLAGAVEGCNRHLLTLKRECDGVAVVDDFESLVGLLLRLNGRIEQFLDDHEHFEHSDELLEFYFGIRHFLNIYENMDEKDYVQYTKLCENGDFEANLMCANPAKPVRACTDRAVFTVFFSATLIPIDYYRMMLGADETDPAVYARSVFDPAKRALIVAKDVTSRYSRRCDSEYDMMARYISAFVSAKEGNYMVFFPSFAMLERVLEIYMSRYHDNTACSVIVQSGAMSETERDDFLSRFSKEDGSASEYDEDPLPDFAGMEVEIDETLDEEAPATLIGFCVLGGIFSEGIDLKNDALIGAMIVGTALPMVCTERELLRRCYEDMGLDGFAYAYRYPGMNKVLQAAGRVIRTEEDRGVVALLDERFLGNDYLRLFPREWKDYVICRVDDIGEILEQFWGKDTE